MNDSLLSAIKALDFTALRNICLALSQEERQELKSYFVRKNFNFIFREVLKEEKRYHFSNKELAIISYTIMCVCNTLEEVRKIELFQNIEPYVKGNYYYFLSSLEDEVLLDFVQSPQGAYMIEGIQLMYKDNPLEMSFQILWSVYKAGYIPLNEGIFIQRMYDLNWFKADEHLTKYLLKHPETIVLFPSVPAYIQDTIFTTEEWKKIYHTLNKKEYFTNKNAILHAFIEALLNPWKKTVLDMYCRWIETLEPSHQELLSNQHTLFALLSSDKTSVINFVMKLIKEIADEKDFDFQAFADNFALCFATQKIAKSQLIGLNILEKHYKQQPPTHPDYREQLAVLFTVPDVKLQEKVANLLTTYFNHEGLPEVIAPYCDYLKGKAQDLLATLSPSESPNSSENSENSPTACATRSLTPITYPLRPEDLLFLLGDCLRERTATTIDLFFEGLVQLQDQLPENFKEQLAPYIAQVNGMYYTNVQLAALQLLLAGWVENRPLESPEEWNKMNTQVRRLNTEEEEPFKQACVLHNVWYLRDEIPYLLYKVKATLDKLKSGSKLPFLSTPTHASFYIDAETLADRLLAYQTAGKEVDLDDLVVACNRLLLSTITPEAQEKVRSLSGQYAPALGYLFGLSDVVTPTEELLPLWTQITRLKHPDKVFTEFETTAAKDYLSAVKPFFPSYEIEGEFKQFFLEKVYIDDYYNYTLASPFDNSVFDRLPYNYYNAGAYNRWDTDTLRYVISLNPQYVDIILGKYTPLYVGDSDAETQRNLREPLQLLLEYDLPVHHGGWIFIGMALLHDKKETRDLTAEYILRAISRDEDLSYLQHFLADILAQKLTPINRFVEFLDMPTRDPKIKAFQKAVVEAYLPLAEKQEKKPTNHKKLANWLM